MAKQNRRKELPEEAVEDVIKGLQRVDLSPVTHWLSTGCTILDLAIANQLPGGFAGGRISHVYGPESSAKSVLAQEPLGSAQRQGGEAWFGDAEFTLDLQRAHLFGMSVADPATFHYYNPASIEELFDTQIKAALKGRNSDSSPGAFSVDSLSALPSKAELEDSLSDSGYGMTRAKQLSRAFRKFILPLSKANLALIFVDQTRDDVGNPFNKYTVSGGNALKFYASTRVLLEHKGQIKNASKKVIGVKIGFKVTKNKVAPPFRDGEFLLFFDRGIDNVSTNLQWMRDNSSEPKDSGSWYTFNGNKYGPGLTAAAIAIEKSKLEIELEDAVFSRWKEVYALPERSPRIRRDGS